MHELSTELGRFIGGGITLDQLRASFRTYLTQHGEEREPISRWLRNTVEEGRLSVTIWLSLRDLFEDPPAHASLDAAVSKVSVGKAGRTQAAIARPDASATRMATRLPAAVEVGAEPDGKLQPGMTVKGRFVLVEQLGSGGMGEVFKARDLIREEAHDRNPFVALKVLNKEVSAHPDAFMALQREASRASKLAHPNVVTVYDFDRDGSRIFMTMEYLEGRRLDEVMSEEAEKGMPLEKAWPLIRGIGLALSYGHEKRIVHSDLKPSNIFLCKEGPVKVLDFGIARLVNPTESHAGDATLFDPRTRLGGLTPAYASLEMWNREPPDPRDDIYALACVTYELLSGRHPFDRLAAHTVAKRQLAPARINQLTRTQWEGLKKGLALRREHRTASVAEFMRAFAPRSNVRKYAIPGAAAAVLITAGALTVSARYYRDVVEGSTLEMLQCAQIPKPAPPPAEQGAFTPSPEQRQMLDDDIALARDYLSGVGPDTAIDEVKHVLSDGANSVNYILDHALGIDPSHAGALQLKAQIAELYAQRARALLDERRVDEALDLVRYSRSVSPSSVELFRLEQTVCRAAAEIRGS